MSVRNRVASFEAYNEEVRQTSPEASPTSPSSVNSWRQQDEDELDDLAGDHRQQQQQQQQPHIDGESPDRPASHTALASQNRITRLQRLSQRAAGPTSTDNVSGSTTTSTNNAHNSRTTSSLHTKATEFSRRRMKQHQQQGGPSQPILEDSTNAEQDDDDSSSAKDQTSHTAAAASARSSRLGKMHYIKKMRNTHAAASISNNTNSSASATTGSTSNQANSTSTPIKTGSSTSINSNRSRRQQKYLQDRLAQQHNSRAAAKDAEDTEDADNALATMRQIAGMPQEEDEVPQDELMSKQPLHWNIGEEKSDKGLSGNDVPDYHHPSSSRLSSSRGIVMARSSSSDYETDGDRSRGPSMSSTALYRQQLLQDPHGHGNTTQQQQSRGQDANTMMRHHQRDMAVGRSNQNSQHNYYGTNTNTTKDDDDTYDYSGRDEEEINRVNNSNTYATGSRTFESQQRKTGMTNDHGRDATYDDEEDSQTSMTYSQRRDKETRRKEEQARKQAAAAAKAGMDNPFVRQDDVEKYKQTLDRPEVKTGIGVVAAAAIGCTVMGPVGLLIGAAAVGIGVGVMQIPPEQRSVMCDKATETIKGAHESAIHASEALSNSCANSYQTSGCAEHVPAEMQNCCSAIDHEVSKVRSNGLDTVGTQDDIGSGGEPMAIRTETFVNNVMNVKDGAGGVGVVAGGAGGGAIMSPLQRLRPKKEAVALFREGTSCSCSWRWILNGCSSRSVIYISCSWQAKLFQ